MLRQRSTLAFAAIALVAIARIVPAADLYDAAVAHAGRSADDRKRDPVDHPAEVLRAAGIRPGMRVADFLAAEGYYSELLAYVVGEKGHVLLLNNAGYDKFAKNGWKDRIEHQHLAQVEHRTVDLDHMGLDDGSLDAILVVKAYHDLYWVAPEYDWNKIDVPAVLDQLVRALKPGGTLLVVDHSAKAGTGIADAGPLHRIDEAYARKDFESHGLEFVRKADFLRHPEDPRDQVSYKPPIVGKTDRFVLVFRKPK